ncbi:MAG: ATP-binding cassette domain-containing protein [Candidatus Lokiarchaeota archaeon]|nr:ATP-binding cassette domain-containing protein [Candidatus Lokiarchaeota archaeon]
MIKKEKIIESGKFLGNQFDLMLDWIKKRRFKEIEIVITLNQTVSDKLEVFGKVLKTENYNLYQDYLFILADKITFEEKNYKISAQIIKISPERKPIPFVNTIKRVLNKKNEKKLQIINNIILFNKDEVASDILFELKSSIPPKPDENVIFIENDIKSATEYLNTKLLKYYFKVVVSGVYTILDKEYNWTLYGEILWSEFRNSGKLIMDIETISPSSLQVDKLIVIEGKKRNLTEAKIYGMVYKQLPFTNSKREKGFHPECIVFIQNDEREDNEKLIHIEDVTVKFGDRIILDKINMEVNKGEIVGIIGESGAGKSTTIKAILGELKYEGKITAFGIDARFTKRIASKIGYVPQDLSLIYHEFTPLENMIHFGRQFGLDEEIITRKSKRILTDLNIPNFMDVPVASLSGGQKRRVSVAIALVHDPEILILDEPTSGLDPMTRFELWKYLDWINKKYGKTLIVISHYLDEIEYSDRSAVYLVGVGMHDFDTPMNLKLSLPGGGTSIEITLRTIDIRALDVLKEIIGVSHVIQRGERIRILLIDEETNADGHIIEEIKERFKENKIDIFEIEEGVVTDMIDYFTVKSQMLGSGQNFETHRIKTKEVA